MPGGWRRRAEVLAWAAPLVVLGACGLQAPVAGALLPDDPPRVAKATFEVRARHTDILRISVFFPADGSGRVPPAPGGAQRPALVLIQGGLVSTTDYGWLAEALARDGYVVALPENTAELAFFSIDNGRFARELLAKAPPGSVLDGVVDPARIAVAGHSLGGVVAGKLALGGGFGALAFLASFPDTADDARLPSLGMPSLSLAGRLDCSAKLADVEAGAAKLPPPTALAVLDGATHYEFTGSAKPDLDRGCTPGIPLETAHDRMALALRTFLDAALGPDKGTGAAALGQIDGLEVTAR